MVYVLIQNDVLRTSSIITKTVLERVWFIIQYLIIEKLEVRLVCLSKLSEGWF